MISSIRHVGFVVKNLEESLKFYIAMIRMEHFLSLSKIS